MLVLAGRLTLVCPCLRSMGERRLWVCLYSISSDLHILFVLLGWFVRWAESGPTVVILWSATPRICLKRHEAFLCSSHLAFSLIVSLRSKYCNHIIVRTWLEMVKIHVLFNQEDQIFMGPVNRWPINCGAVLLMRMLTSLLADEILLPMSGPLISEGWKIFFYQIKSDIDICSITDIEHSLFIDIINYLSMNLSMWFWVCVWVGDDFWQFSLELN